MFFLEEEMEALEKFRAYQIERNQAMDLSFGSIELASYETLLNDLVYKLIQGAYRVKMDDLITEWRKQDAYLFEEC